MYSRQTECGARDAHPSVRSGAESTCVGNSRRRERDYPGRLTASCLATPVSYITLFASLLPQCSHLPLQPSYRSTLHICRTCCPIHLPTNQTRTQSTSPSEPRLPRQQLPSTSARRPRVQPPPPTTCYRPHKPYTLRRRLLLHFLAMSSPKRRIETDVGQAVCCSVKLSGVLTHLLSR